MTNQSRNATMNSGLSNIGTLAFFGMWAWGFLIFILWMVNMASFEQAAVNMILAALNLVGMGLSSHV